MTVQNFAVINLPFKYIDGLKISNNASTPNTKIDISQGSCRDSSDGMDIRLGADNPNVQGDTVTSPLVLDATIVGANGIDESVLVASTVYAVYMIADSRGYQTTSSILSLATNVAPLLPFGFDAYRLIGYVATDGSANILKGGMSGAGNWRVWIYDAPVSIGTGLSNTTYAAQSLVASVPNQENVLVYLDTVFTANAAADTINVKKFNGSGDQFGAVAPVAGGTAVTPNRFWVPATLDSGVPKIESKVSAGTYDLSTIGFGFSV